MASPALARVLAVAFTTGQSRTDAIDRLVPTRDELAVAVLRMGWPAGCFYTADPGCARLTAALLKAHLPVRVQ